MKTFLKQNRRKKMKKVLLALLLVATSFLAFGQSLFAADEETGNLVVHFKAWNGNYDTLGSWAWGGPAAGKLKDGVDDFGAYWNYNNIPVGTSVGFIAVEWPSGEGPDWGQKLTGDVNIAASAIVANKTTHVYVFQGAETKPDNPAHFIGMPDTTNLLVVYYDPTNNYEENLGIHFWGWEAAGPEWNQPAKLFTNTGVSEAGIPLKAVMMSYPAESWAGLLIYYGDGDGSKKTGDVTMSGGGATEDGEVGIAYVVNKGDGNTSGNNVFYNDFAAFADEAFSFKLMPFNSEDRSGTYAVDKNTIIVKTSANVVNPYPTAVDKEAAIAQVEGWFSVREITGEGTWGAPLAIERVDFARNNATLNAFVIVLDDDLDNTKDYEVFFETDYPEALEEAVEVQVTINVTVPANTPAEAALSIAGSLQGWSPGQAAYTATKVGDTLVYTVTFTIEVTEPYTIHEYKWTRGAWGTEEHVEGNRPLVIPNNVASIVVEDVVEAWTDIEAPAEKYAAPSRVASAVPKNVSASIELDLDRSAPQIIFIAPTSIVGKVAAERIIVVPWGQPFNVNQFPRFRAEDDRDGDITAFVYVPKGANSVLDTRTEGDYTIMLRVVDTWGNVTSETFIFRVTKTS
jgi:hypothetical protein